MLVLGFSSHVEWSKVVHKEKPTLNVRPSHEKYDIDSQVRLRMISHNYVSIMFLYLPRNEYGFTKEISNIKC